MSCGCNKTTLQGKKYCQDCTPDEYHWLVPVSKNAILGAVIGLVVIMLAFAITNIVIQGVS